jgi:PAS domain S-box-containing protein
LAQGDPSIFTELLEVLDEAVTIRDVGGEIVNANRAALVHLGFESLEQLKTRSSRSIMDDYVVEDEHGHPLTMEDVPSVRLMRDQPAGPVLMRVVNRSTGEVRWNLLRATALRDEDGSFLGAMTVIENVTAVKTAEVHTRVLAESGRVLASSLDYQQTLRNVADLAVPALADWCAVDLIDQNLRREHVVAAHRDPAKQQLAARLREFEPTELHPEQALGRVFLTGISELYPEVTDGQLVQGAVTEEHLELLRELGMRSVTIVPMQVPTRTIGLMTLVTAESLRRLDAQDVDLAEQLARRAAVAVENSRLHTTLAGVAETLQQSLLPADLPEVPGWEAAAIYLPADAEQRIDVGGDFYEVFNNGDTWFAMIGDVTGKGVTAASLTSLMRHGARVACRLEPGPAAILHRLDEALRQQPGDSMCTVLCLRLCPDHVVVSSAGHPPALLVSGDGAVREAPESGPLLGAFSDGTWTEEKLTVGPDDTLILYTDGVIETRGASDRFGLERLRSLLSRHADEAPADVLSRLSAELDAFRAGAGRDDVAVLALRPRR